jgi:hypothetical protein
MVSASVLAELRLLVGPGTAFLHNRRGKEQLLLQFRSRETGKTSWGRSLMIYSLPTPVNWTLVLWVQEPQRRKGIGEIAGSTEAARKILLNAQPGFPTEGIIYYNLACYECQSNRIESAKQYLKQSFRIEPNWRLQAQL